VELDAAPENQRAREVRPTREAHEEDLVVLPVLLLEVGACVGPAVDEGLLVLLLRFLRAGPDVATGRERRAREDRLELARLRLTRERPLLEPLPVDVLRDHAVEEDDERPFATLGLTAVDVAEPVGQRIGALAAPRDGRGRLWRRDARDLVLRRGLGDGGG